MEPMETTRIIREKLTRALAPQHLEIRDESRLHAGHAAAGTGGHYAVIVVSSRFEGLPPAERHRLVYRALAGEMQASIHALALAALTPAEHRSGPADHRDVSTLG